MQKKLKLEDLESQYRTFCENARAVKQNTTWRTVFNKTTTDQNEEKKNEAI